MENISKLKPKSWKGSFILFFVLFYIFMYPTLQSCPKFIAQAFL